jgi:hypothetical protein
MTSPRIRNILVIFDRHSTRIQTTSGYNKLESELKKQYCDAAYVVKLIRKWLG